MQGRDTRGTPACSEVNRRTPVRDGDRYCSPDCGLGCRWDAYLRATEAANELCRMLGPDWRPLVWENLGWFYEAARGNVTVRYRAGNGGKASPRFGCSYDGPGRQYHTESVVSPNAAVADVRRQVDEEVEALRRGLVTLVADGPGMPDADAMRAVPRAHAPGTASPPEVPTRATGRHGSGAGSGRGGVRRAG